MRTGPLSGGAHEPAPCLVEPAGLEHIRGLPPISWSPWAAPRLVGPVGQPPVLVEPVGRPVSRGARGPARVSWGPWPELRELCVDCRHGSCQSVTGSAFWPNW